MPIACVGQITLSGSYKSADWLCWSYASLHCSCA